MKRILYLVLLITLAAATITESAKPAAAAVEENAALARGRELFQAGNLNQSLAVLRAFVQQTADPDDSAAAYSLIGQIFYRHRQFADAILYLQRIPVGLRDPQATFILGKSLVETGRYADALKLLRPLQAEAFNPADKHALYQALTFSAIEERRFLLALFFLQKQLPYSVRQATLLQQAHDILQNRINDADLAEAAFMWQGTEVGQDARLQLARRALVQQQPDIARRHLEELFAATVMFPYWQEAEMLLQRTTADAWLSRDSIGVLLPLSGDYASYGELVKRGLDLALAEHNKTRLPIRFIYRDTAIDTVSSAQLVSGLTDDDKVMAVIGPLLATHAMNAARRAQREMVPLLALSQANALPEVGNFIFRDTLTAEQQVETLVDYAIGTNHIAFSVLRPDNRLGQQMADLFVAAVLKKGGEIVDVVSYPEDNTDFRQQIQQLMWEPGEKPTPAEETAEEPELEYPLPPFDALFIPDFADRIVQIAPQLMFYGVKDVTLLGINGWNSNELADRAGRFLKHAVFVDAFFLNSDRPEVRRFVELYRQTYDEDPSILEAQAFDAATVILQIMDDPNVGNRADIRRQLLELQNFRGVTGTGGFDQFGEAIKLLNLLQVKSGRIVPLSQQPKF